MAMVNPFWAAQAARDGTAAATLGKSASMRENACGRKRQAAWHMALDEASGHFSLAKLFKVCAGRQVIRLQVNGGGDAFAEHDGDRNRGNSSDSRFLTGTAAQQGRGKHAGGVTERW